MSRTLKFRAWHNNKMHYLGSLERATLTQGGDYFLLITKNEHHVDGSEPLADAEVMQFTGAVDINGKEIYEHDIVRWSSDWETYTRVVKWNDDDAMFHPNDMKDEVEVIGNVHENIDLLEERQ